jgi:hypothetical protein
MALLKRGNNAEEPEQGSMEPTPADQPTENPPDVDLQTAEATDPSEPPAAAEVVPAAPAPDDLLQMFATNDAGGEDRTLLLDLALDVSMAELLEELQTIAASLVIVHDEWDREAAA